MHFALESIDTDLSGLSVFPFSDYGRDWVRQLSEDPNFFFGTLSEAGTDAWVHSTYFAIDTDAYVLTLDQNDIYRIDITVENLDDWLFSRTITIYDGDGRPVDLVMNSTGLGDFDGNVVRSDPFTAEAGGTYFAFVGIRKYSIGTGPTPYRLELVKTGDSITGTTDDEILRGDNGNDTITGAGGSDTLMGDAGDDVLYGDGLKVAFVPDVALQVYRLYQATLDREPDMGGHLGWTQAIFEDASTPAQVAAGFVDSREFRSVYGLLDDAGFVELLYQNVLNRASDPGGLQGWLDALSNGASRADVVLGFSDSREFQNTTRTDATAWVNSHTDSIWSNDVYRLYGATLDRQPDLGGFLDWVGRLGSGTPFLTAIEGFTGSREFQNTYGALDDAAFVELLYQNVLDRAADAAGLADWLGRLGAGTTRAQVVEGFAQSREFVGATAAPLEAWMRGHGTDDVLEGGSGTNILTGGLMSDTFVFDQSDAGTHTVLDLEAWDNLRFNGFGYATAAEALSNMTQDGMDVVFTDQGTTVIFAQTALSDFTDGMFI